ncbi:MAG: InlB B-repeat-containing protein, partial [Methanosphaera sp.]|nr:InlB B-repeat-containing protein [Methanosphaera sp.]
MLNNKTVNFNTIDASETIEVTSNGKLEGNIYNNQLESITYKEKVIDKIDTTGPEIALNSDETKTVKQTVTIPLKVTDVGSGINQDSFGSDDVLVKIGDDTITSITLTKKECTSANECIYNLKIEDRVHAGKVKIIIGANKVLDKIDNGNNEKTLDTNITFSNIYTITYNANGGSGAPSATTYTYAESGTTNLSSTKPTRSGYTFLGWSKSSSATTASYSAGQEWNRNDANDYILYAVWKVNTYTITYNANGGSGAPSATTYTYASSGTINLSSTRPTRTGYTFLGWSTSSTATTASYSAGQAWNKSNANNYTLYAVWKKNTTTTKKPTTTTTTTATKSCTNFNCGGSSTHKHCEMVSGNPTCVCDSGYVAAGNMGTCAPKTTVAPTTPKKTTAKKTTKSKTTKKGGGCFLAGTKIVTNGGYKDIDKIKIGDMVLTYNEGTKNKEYHKVTKLYAYNPDDINEELYTLTFDDKTTLQVSSTHRFYIVRNEQ